jgi:hypothetical protein
VNLTDLRAELRRQAQDAPDPSTVRSEVAGRSDRILRRRRTGALVGTAAAVVVLLAGAGVATATLRHGSTGPAGPLPVVDVPEVALPADSALVRHQLPMVVSPVLAPAPRGMDGSGWIDTPGRLAVGYGVASGGAATTDGQSGPPSAGYVITAGPDDTLTGAPPTAPGSGDRTVRPTATSTTVGGHPAQLQVAPPGTVDALGFPAERRLVWQLGTGQWIHVWAQGADDPHRLETFAAGITERSTPLYRAIGIGVTLPGLVDDSSMNFSVLDASVPDAVYLCPPGTQPLVSTAGTGAVSSTAGTTDTPTPGTPAPTASGPQRAPSASCLIAGVIAAPLDRVRADGAPTPVTVGDRTVYVDVSAQTALADLGSGITAAITAPATAHLTTADLAAAVSSVRLSSAVSVLPGTGGVVVEGSAGVVSTYPASSADLSGTSPPSSTAAEPPSSSAAEPPSSTAARMTATPTIHAPASAAADAATQVLNEYLGFVRQGDCPAAAGLYVGTYGNLCGVLTLAEFTVGQAAAVGDRELDVATTLTTSGSQDGTIPAGTVTWFFVLTKQPDGSWRITDAGSGP